MIAISADNSVMSVLLYILVIKHCEKLTMNNRMGDTYQHLYAQQQANYT